MSKKKSVRLLRVLNSFKDKCAEHKPSDYKSFSMLRKINKTFTFKLMFGYTKGRNPIYSKEVEVEDAELALVYVKILDDGLKLDVVSNNIFDGIEDDEDEFNH